MRLQPFGQHPLALAGVNVARTCAFPTFQERSTLSLTANPFEPASIILNNPQVPGNVCVTDSPPLGTTVILAPEDPDFAGQINFADPIELPRDSTLLPSISMTTSALGVTCSAKS